MAESTYQFTVTTTETGRLYVKADSFDEAKAIVEDGQGRDLLLNEFSESWDYSYDTVEFEVEYDEDHHREQEQGGNE